MIPAASILIDGDTALWVVESDQITSFRIVDRPCDTCGGPGVRMVEAYTTTIPEDVACPDCDGSGRHTFMVEVECHACPEFAGIAHKRTLRGHVIDVLPIHADIPWPEKPDTPIIVMAAGRTVLANFDGQGYTDITLPSAAEPGMWLIRLATHTTENVEEPT